MKINFTQTLKTVGKQVIVTPLTEITTPLIILNDDKKEIGRLGWDGQRLRFVGMLDDSAAEFFHTLKTEEAPLTLRKVVVDALMASPGNKKLDGEELINRRIKAIEITQNDELDLDEKQRLYLQDVVVDAWGHAVAIASAALAALSEKGQELPVEGESPPRVPLVVLETVASDETGESDAPGAGDPKRDHGAE